MPKILNIVTHPNKELRKVSEKIDIEKINKNIKTFCYDLSATMVEKDGIGLASPQVGEKIRLIAVNTKTGPVCMINPVITKTSWRKEWGEEGCLSVPDTFGKVKRNCKLDCSYLDENGNEHRINATGLMARVIQHEIDHLDGILFIDKAKDIKKLSESA